MATELPIPIEFTLPDGWQPAPPDEVGAAGAAFVALNSATQGSGFTANITIDGDFRPADLSLPQLADDSVQGLRSSAPDVTVVSRNDIGDKSARGLTQDLRMSAEASGALRELVQSQVYLPMADDPERHRRAVIRVVLTATVEQYDTVLEDFRSFLTTLRPDAEAARN